MTYINREALLDRLIQIAEASENPAYLIAMRTAMAEIACAPEELVRCKNCAHRREDEDYASGHYCVKRPSNGGYFCDDGDFCSYGEPKEGAE